MATRWTQNLGLDDKIDADPRLALPVLSSSPRLRNGMSDGLRYGIIKYNKKENTFIISSSNRTMIYDSRTGFLDLKALSLKDDLERHK